MSINKCFPAFLNPADWNDRPTAKQMKLGDKKIHCGGSKNDSWIFPFALICLYKIKMNTRIFGRIGKRFFFPLAERQWNKSVASMKSVYTYRTLRKGKNERKEKKVEQLGASDEENGNSRVLFFIHGNFCEINSFCSSFEWFSLFQVLGNTFFLFFIASNTCDKPFNFMNASFWPFF